MPEDLGKLTACVCVCACDSIDSTCWPFLLYLKLELILDSVWVSCSPMRLWPWLSLWCRRRRYWCRRNPTQCSITVSTLRYGTQEYIYGSAVSFSQDTLFYWLKNVVCLVVNINPYTGAFSGTWSVWIRGEGGGRHISFKGCQKSYGQSL